MKKILHSILLFAGTCVALTSCSNGEYVANPGSAANTAVNPLKPLTASQFTWGGTGSLSATINGVSFVADTAAWRLDSSGTNLIAGSSGDTRGFALNLRNVYAGNIYSLAYHIYNTEVIYTVADTANKLLNGVYYSYLGNSGEVYITENDSAYIKGLFYFEGVDDSGKLVTVNNGYFNVAKPIIP